MAGRHPLQGELVGVLVPARSADPALRVTSVEVFEDGFLVHWVSSEAERVMLSAEERQNLRPGGADRVATTPTLSDDLGNAYRWCGSGAGGGGGMINGEWMFMPGLAPEATELRLAWDVPRLPGADGSGPERREQLVLDPRALAPPAS